MEMENENHLLDISLNYEGRDVRLRVDNETAHMLWNDADMAKQYVERILALDLIEGPTQTKERWEVPEEELVEETVNEPLDELEEEAGDEASCSTTQNVWCSKRPGRNDHEATKLFLKLREKYSAHFEDKKHIKNQVWAEVAEEMVLHGFNIGVGKEAVEKLRQKFANLQKQYLKHVQHMKSTGKDRKEPPPFFDEMHGLLGEKDKTNPKHLQDTLEGASSKSPEDLHCEPEPLDEAVKSKEERNVQIKSRFSTCKSVRPKSTNTEIMDLLKTQHSEDKEERRQHFRTFENLLSQQIEQRDKTYKYF